jgi:hypothetical protein
MIDIDSIVDDGDDNRCGLSAFQEAVCVVQADARERILLRIFFKPVTRDRPVRNRLLLSGEQLTEEEGQGHENSVFQDRAVCGDPKNNSFGPSPR